MASLSLKDRLIERIKSVEDPSIIDHLYQLLELELDLKSESTYVLSAEEEAALNEAEADILSGRLLSEEEASQRIKKWVS